MVPRIKQYRALYTCLSTRAIYTKVDHSLNTDSFIICFRRFIGQKENVGFIKFNKRSNYIGLELQKISFMHFQKWIIQGSVSIWKNMVGNKSIGKETLHLQVTWGDFGNGKFGVLKQPSVPC